MLIKNKIFCENVKLQQFGKKHGKNTAFWQIRGIHDI